MHAEIIAIGDEITSGQLLDTNTQWLSQRLQELGIRVLYHTTVGDELEPCAGVFRQAIARIRRLPALLIPWSRCCSPLLYGVGTRPTTPAN